MQETYNSSRAAKQVGIPGSTLRLWAKVYGEFLSESASPPAGQERRFTSGDIDVLRSINQLRANGLQPADVAVRLRNNATMGVQAATIAPGDVAAVPAVGNDVAPAHDAIQAFLARTETAAALESLDRRLERVEQRNNLVWVALGGVAVGALLVTLVVLLVSMVR